MACLLLHQAVRKYLGELAAILLFHFFGEISRLTHQKRWWNVRQRHSFMYSVWNLGLDLLILNRMHNIPVAHVIIKSYVNIISVNYKVLSYRSWKIARLKKWCSSKNVSKNTSSDFKHCNVLWQNYISYHSLSLGKKNYSWCKSKQ